MVKITETTIGTIFAIEQFFVERERKREYLTIFETRQTRNTTL